MSFSQEVFSKLEANQLEDLLTSLKSPAANQAVKTSEANDFIKVIAMTICKCVQLDPELSTRDEVIYECCRLLRNSCALGETVQNEIASYNSSSTINLFQSISIVMGKQSPISVSQKTRKMCWQLLANLCVQNEFTQHLIWQQCQNALVVEPQCACDTENARECTMILYNLFIGSCLSSADAKRIVEFLLECTKTSMRSHELDNNDFYHLFMEHLVTKHRNAVPIIDKLEPEKRLYIFYYIADHMKDPSHELIASNLLQYICREFKKKSDCVLKTVTSYVDSIHPKEVVALLDVIAQASPNEHYTHLLANDGSLFLNVGCLLQSITKIGGEANSQSIFAPVQRLEQLAPNSTDGASIERDISYQLKSTLIRTLGNLAYKNRKNQDLAREMDIILAVLNSTTLDARNPLIKEWSILAIRNLCEDNFENQQIIRQLTKVGDAKNSDVLKEFNLDLGSLRINPN